MYEILLDALHRLDEYNGIISNIQQRSPTDVGKTTEVVGLADSQRAHVLAELSRDLDRPLLIVTDTALKAEALLADLANIFDGGAAILPPREINFNSIASSRDIASRRLDALYRAATGRLRALIAPLEAMLDRVIPPEELLRHVRTMRVGDVYDLQALTAELIGSGYERVDMIEGRGQFAVRGGILDVYSPGDLPPMRIEFFDDEVDSIRALDIVTQRSGDRQDEAVILPATEVPIEPGDRRAAELAARFSALKPRTHAGVPDLPIEAAGEPVERWVDVDDDDELPDLFGAASDSLIKSYAAFESGAGVQELSADAEPAAQNVHLDTAYENVINLLRDDTCFATEYLKLPIIALEQPERLQERYDGMQFEFNEQFKAALEGGIVLPQQAGLRFGYDQFLSAISKRDTIVLSPFLRRFDNVPVHAVVTMNVISATAYSGNMKELSRDINRWRQDGWNVLILAGGNARAQRLQATLSEQGFSLPIADASRTAMADGDMFILPVALDKGFMYSGIKLAVLTEHDLFGSKRQKSKKRRYSGDKINVFTDLKVGDYVVHEMYGIGVYRGMQRMASDGVYRDYLYIQYQDSDKLYVPTDQLDRVQKYIGKDGVAPKLNRLSGTEWKKQKARVKAAIEDMTEELVKLYARRSAVKGFAFSPDTPWQAEFEDAFPYEETPDQLSSIAEIKADMEKDMAMDRLLCGDVGYGKTEVALRAAFKAVMDSKQVAILAPTTILVQQHYQTILNRFAGYPIRVDTLSRFKTAAQQRATLRELLAGKIDILVGTHRMLGKDVMFKDLGLLVVDEEQRFGVKHKEAIKQLKSTSSIDVLTLSATPIPRTLHMSMVGIRDMSVLETPPEDRFPVQTYVIEYNDALIRDAIMREKQRGGQVYLLYNRVGSIDRYYAHLHRLVPEVRIAVGHGQMAEHELEDIMYEFYNGEFDVLLCTTIIESGLDVANANTMIIYDADRFGLSQLYQLRGRVGRSNRLAYCYLCVKPGKALTETADKRLAAIKEFTEFGSGFRVAMRDLEIRGAGNLLGAQQSGHMSDVGYDLYCKMIEEAMLTIRGEVRPVNLESRVDIKLNAYLPMDYVSGDYQRIEIYKKISGISSQDEWGDMVEELTDRFGDPTRPVMNLIQVAYMRKLCEKLYIETAASQGGMFVFRFMRDAQLDPEKLLKVIAKHSDVIRFNPTDKPTMTFNKNRMADEDFMGRAIQLLEELVAGQQGASEH